MVIVLAVYAAAFATWVVIGHFFGAGVQHTLAWLAVVAVVSYYANDYADTKRRLKAAECKLQSIPLT